VTGALLEKQKHIYCLLVSELFDWFLKRLHRNKTHLRKGT